MSKKCGRYPENATYPKKNIFNASILFQNSSECEKYFLMLAQLPDPQNVPLWLARGIFVIRIFCSLRKEKKEFQINKELSSHPKISISSTYCNYLRAILFYQQKLNISLEFSDYFHTGYLILKNKINQYFTQMIKFRKKVQFTLFSLCYSNVRSRSTVSKNLIYIILYYEIQYI